MQVDLVKILNYLAETTSMSDHQIYRHTGTVAETVITDDICRIVAVIPESTTTGTVTLRDEAEISQGDVNVVHICAIGLSQEGKHFTQRGAMLRNGLTVQLSVAGDIVAIVWARKHE